MAHENLTCSARNNGSARLIRPGASDICRSISFAGDAIVALLPRKLMRGPSWAVGENNLPAGEEGFNHTGPSIDSMTIFSGSFSWTYRSRNPSLGDLGIPIAECLFPIGPLQ